MNHALIIDDNEQNAAILSQMLLRENVIASKVTRIANFEAALADVANVDIVFLDLEMPNIDGYATLDLLREDARFDGVPIIAYTVHISEILSAIQHGFDGFISKPLDASRFPGQLARILRGEPVWEPA